jgi:hypothetical protein
LFCEKSIYLIKIQLLCGKFSNILYLDSFVFNLFFFVEVNNLLLFQALKVDFESMDLGRFFVTVEFWNTDDAEKTLITADFLQR